MDVVGLCKVASVNDIKSQGWSLNPGRYVGAMTQTMDTEDFRERLEELQEEFERLTGEAQKLELQIGIRLAELV